MGAVKGSLGHALEERYRELEGPSFDGRIGTNMGARVTTLIGRSTQAGPGAGIEVGVPHAVVRRTRPVTDLIEISPPGGLPRSAEGIEVVEGRVAGFGVGAGLQEGTLAISRSRRRRSGMGQLLVMPSA
jgi:hypothetical protein